MFVGSRFYAHRIALLASSDAFRAMFDGGYRVCILCLRFAELLLIIGSVVTFIHFQEKEAKDIEIPNISWKVFELMMRYGCFMHMRSAKGWFYIRRTQ